MNHQNHTSNGSAKPQPTNFWQGKRVIVTGGGGFLGSFVVNKLWRRGAAEVIVPRRKDYDLRNVATIRQLLRDTAIPVQTGDKQETRADNRTRSVRLAPRQTKPVDMVIHLAANVGGIGVNQAKPAEFFYDNLMMGVQLLHECWQAGVPKFVATGTICAYPKFAPIPFQEETLWDGYPEETNAPYGLAKKMMLVQSQAYRAQYGYNSIFLLPVNLYGPRDNFDLTTSHVIPALIRKCLDAGASTGSASTSLASTGSAGAAVGSANKELVAWGDGSPTREFLYVEDAAEGILLAAEHYNESEPVNLGSSYEISIRDLLQTIARLTGFTGRIIWDTTKPNGQPRRKLDVSRAKALFGFEAQTPFEVGLQRTIEWYRQEMAKSAQPVRALAA